MSVENIVKLFTCLNKILAMNCQNPEMIAIELDFDMLSQSTVMRILRDESGASAIEYGLILAMISIGLIASMQSLALGVNTIWDTATTGAQGALTAPSS